MSPIPTLPSYREVWLGCELGTESSGKPLCSFPGEASLPKKLGAIALLLSNWKVNSPLGWYANDLPLENVYLLTVSLILLIGTKRVGSELRPRSPSASFEQPFNLTNVL